MMNQAENSYQVLTGISFSGQNNTYTCNYISMMYKQSILVQFM